jgi:hypothetical protein
MYTIICKEMTGKDCGFVATAETTEKAKKIFYQHGAEADIHKEHYATASSEEKAAFGKTLDEYLAKQN